MDLFIRRDTERLHSEYSQDQMFFLKLRHLFHAISLHSQFMVKKSQTQFVQATCRSFLSNPKLLRTIQTLTLALLLTSYLITQSNIDKKVTENTSTIHTLQIQFTMPCAIPTKLSVGELTMRKLQYKSQSEFQAILLLYFHDFNVWAPFYRIC